MKDISAHESYTQGPWNNSTTRNNALSPSHSQKRVAKSRHAFKYQRRQRFTLTKMCQTRNQNKVKECYFLSSVAFDKCSQRIYYHGGFGTMIIAWLHEVWINDYTVTNSLFSGSGVDKSCLSIRTRVWFLFGLWLRILFL